MIKMIKRIPGPAAALILALSMNTGLTQAAILDDLQQGVEIKTIISNEMTQANATIEKIVVDLLAAAPDKMAQIITAAIELFPDLTAQIIEALTEANPSAAGEIQDIINNLPAPEAGGQQTLPLQPPSRNDKPIGVSPGG